MGKWKIVFRGVVGVGNMIPYCIDSLGLVCSTLSIVSRAVPKVVLVVFKSSKDHNYSLKAGKICLKKAVKTTLE